MRVGMIAVRHGCGSVAAALAPIWSINSGLPLGGT